MKIKFTDNLNAMNQKILRAFASDIKIDFDKGIRTIQNTLPGLVRKIILSSPEYYSLVGGELKFELGIPDAPEKINAMIFAWTSDIKYKISPPSVVRDRIVGGFSAELIKADFSDILGADYTQVYDRYRGYSLPWFQWLVLEGRTQVVPDHQVSYVKTQRSRTGRAIMVPGAGWGLTNYAGTKENNWITRAIAAGNVEITTLLERAF